MSGYRVEMLAGLLAFACVRLRAVRYGSGVSYELRVQVSVRGTVNWR